ncbi:hypothetical protein CWI36_0259p0030 [Hamiltosporidium magnivora]|uniref:SHSP domain-containing protein n=1 Tax=Hamiltosporidium magnivora TaxID=148818 RepID=A0A4Q9LHE9_9MICR|nr:hypothetical protein CWI36_0259p0030 [Hamiltosporidium magnivora]
MIEELESTEQPCVNKIINGDGYTYIIKIPNKIKKENIKVEYDKCSFKLKYKKTNRSDSEGAMCSIKNEGTFYRKFDFEIKNPNIEYKDGEVYFKFSKGNELSYENKEDRKVHKLKF